MDELQLNDPITLGQYQLLGRLGSGGFGIVYLGVNAAAHKVAIKVLRPELADDQRLRVRLAREARAISAVDGNRTAKVFEVVTDGPFAYIVMEYVQGESLDTLVLQDRKPEGPLLWFIALGLVEALREIHVAGITHRDLKPSNVIVGPDGVKVVDFGISAITDEAGFTQTGTLMGSAAWLSPEQVTGATTDQRTDIFNLGLTLAFLATGEHPFGYGRPDAVMYRITAQAPNLDSILSPLRIAIQKCLQKNPSDRPTLDELERFFSGGGNDSSEINMGTQDQDTTFVVQPDAVSAAANATGPKPTPPGTPHTRASHSKTRIKTLAVSLLAILIIGVLFTLDATNAVDLGVIGSRSELANPPDAELAVSTTAPAPPTTIKVARTTTTTEPPPPAFQLYEWEGRKLRWNPCDGPVEILLNPTDKLTPAQTASLGRFLQEKAIEITEMSGMAVFYAGITDKKTNKSRATGEEIIIQIDEPGNGILLKSDDGFFGTNYFSYGRTQGDFRELNVYQIQINSNELIRLFSNSGEINYDGQRAIMSYLGMAMGLDWLDDQEANAFGLVTTAQKQNEALYWGDGAWSRTKEPKWGPGDKFAMFLVGATNGCF